MKPTNAISESKLLSELTRQYPNHFLLTKAIAIRAKQLKQGSKPLVPGYSIEFIQDRPIIVALDELKSKKLCIDAGIPIPIA
jgi:DNA-directed RNA polymerase, subunit K/omega